MLKIFIEKFILSWLPSAITSFFITLHNDSLSFRTFCWYVKECLKTSLWVIPFILISALMYIKYSQPIYLFADNITWNYKLNDIFGLNMDAMTRAAYTIIGLPFFIVGAIAWRVSYKHKKRRAVLACVAASETIRELKQATEEYEQLIIDILDVFSSVAVVIDHNFTVTHCNDKYADYCDLHNFECDEVLGHSFFYIFTWLSIKPQLYDAFSRKGKVSFITEGRLGFDKRPYEIIIKPSGINGSKKLFVFIKDIQDIQTYVTKPE